MKTIHLIIAVAGLMLLPTSCEWYCHNRNEGNVELLPAHKKTIPYKEGGVYNFVDKDGKVVRFVMTKKEKNWKQETEERWFGGYVDCSDYFMFEEDVITLKAESGNSEISEISMVRSIYAGGVYSLRWDNNVCRIWVFLGITYFQFRCNQDGNFIADSIWLDPTGNPADNPTEFQTYLHKTMKIGNQEYEDVVECRHGKDVLFYDQTYGILKVTRSKKDILTINR